MILSHRGSIQNWCSSIVLSAKKVSSSTTARLRPSPSRLRFMKDLEEPEAIKDEIILGSNSAQPITWYPGHIAKAEKALAEYLKKVDVVIEVRDARIPLSTTHPMVPEWVGSKPLIVVIARIDQISRRALDGWKKYYSLNAPHEGRADAKIFFIDGKLGAGIIPLRREALKAGVTLNERREKRGIQPRAVRAAVIGFPNVGKSALINRLLGKKLARSRNLAGLTKTLSWVRIGGTTTRLDAEREDGLELLDSPGIIPARQLDQEAAMKLAICNDIGEASYDRSAAAAAMCDQVIMLNNFERGYVDMKRIVERYELPFDTLTGEDIVYSVAHKYYRGNITAASDKLLGDFRKGHMGYCSLEAPGFGLGQHVKEGKNTINDNSKTVQKINNDITPKNTRSEKISKHDIGSKIFKDDVGDVIPRKNENQGTLDLYNGNYEGW